MKSNDYTLSLLLNLMSLARSRDERFVLTHDELQMGNFKFNWTYVRLDEALVDFMYAAAYHHAKQDMLQKAEASQ